ncbi:MAG: GTP cyclohydrolase I FolE [Alphaproteobacteria bacterium]|nr:GTP cyclohydrolase I FolE [Alphaproteobacteria bacterium]
MTKNTLKPLPLDENARPSRAEAEEAVRTLIRWAGDNPEREGLIDTPARVTRAYEEFFSGYKRDARDDLSRTFEDIQGFDDMVIVKNIDFTSHCEHHMVPIIGRAHVAYWPDEKIVGISKLARVVDICAKRLVSQETMTQQIVNAIEGALAPKGAAVLIEAAHQCMSIRGVNKADALTVTSLFSGVFKSDRDIQRRFLDLAQ